MAKHLALLSRCHAPGVFGPRLWHSGQTRESAGTQICRVAAPSSAASRTSWRSSVKALSSRRPRRSPRRQVWPSTGVAIVAGTRCRAFVAPSHKQWLSQAFPSFLVWRLLQKTLLFFSHITYTLYYVECMYIVAADLAKRFGTCACLLFASVTCEDQEHWEYKGHNQHMICVLQVADTAEPGKARAARPRRPNGRAQRS